MHDDQHRRDLQGHQSRIGPWYVLQSRNPAAPGMRDETLLGFVRKGRVKARSIVRGPTTHQLWRFACQVKGLGREFGLCYSCGGSIQRDAQLCPQCNRLQDPPADPDVFLEGQGALPTAAEPAAAPPSPVAAGALQETRQTPIFKELKLPPLPDFPTIGSPPPAPLPEPPAPLVQRSLHRPRRSRAAARAGRVTASGASVPATGRGAPRGTGAHARPAGPRTRRTGPMPVAPTSVPPAPARDGPRSATRTMSSSAPRTWRRRFSSGSTRTRPPRKPPPTSTTASPWSGPGALTSRPAPTAAHAASAERARKILLVLVLLVGVLAAAVLALNVRACSATPAPRPVEVDGPDRRRPLPRPREEVPRRRRPPHHRAATGGARPSAPTGALVLPAPPPDPLTESDEAPVPPSIPPHPPGTRPASPRRSHHSRPHRADRPRVDRQCPRPSPRAAAVSDDVIPKVNPPCADESPVPRDDGPVAPLARSDNARSDGTDAASRPR